MTDRLNAGQSLSVGSGLVSPNGRFHFNLQTDGNLVLYGPTGTSLWSSGTAGDFAVEDALMQGDGNVVIRDNAGRVLWASRSNRPGAIGPFIQVQNDGNVVVYAIGSLWATNTST